MILTDEEVITIAREAARGGVIARTGSTSMRIARAIEARIMEKLAEQGINLVLDAERYRWLKEHCAREFTDQGDLEISFRCDFDNFDNIDSAIDAAMKEQGK